MAKTGKVEVVLAVELLRQPDATLWHRPAPQGGIFCGASSGALERRLIPLEDWPPTDGELCPRCEELYQADYQRRLGKIYRLALTAAERSAGAGESAEAANAGTPHG